jgi:hypothetical protein
MLALDRVIIGCPSWSKNIKKPLTEPAAGRYNPPDAGKPEKAIAYS